MTWSEQVFRYCERGADPSFWAEPFNAMSNAAFLIAAAVACRQLVQLPEPDGGLDRKGERRALFGLAALVAMIGAGSFLFHTFATQWALIADVAPITLFMIAYLAFAMRVFLGLGWLAVGVALPTFLFAGSIASSLTCPSGQLIGIAQAARAPCFNGTLGYAPALLALVIVGVLVARRQAAGRLLIGAAALFLISLILRTIDRDACAATWILGQLRGTHALWHFCNAVTLYVLLAAGIGHLRKAKIG